MKSKNPPFVLCEMRFFIRMEAEKTENHCVDTPSKTRNRYILMDGKKDISINEAANAAANHHHSSHKCHDAQIQDYRNSRAAEGHNAMLCCNSTIIWHKRLLC